MHNGPLWPFYIFGVVVVGWGAFLVYRPNEAIEMLHRGLLPIAVAAFGVLCILFGILFFFVPAAIAQP